MTDNVTPFRKLDRGGRRARWHAEVAIAIRAAIEPLSQKAPLSNRFQARPPFASNTDPSGRDESWRMSAR